MRAWAPLPMAVPCVAQPQIGRKACAARRGIRDGIGEIAAAAVAAITKGFSNPIDRGWWLQGVGWRIERSAAGVRAHSAFERFVLLHGCQRTEPCLRKSCQARSGIDIATCCVNRKGFVTANSGKEREGHVAIGPKVTCVLRSHVGQTTGRTVAGNKLELDHAHDLPRRKSSGLLLLVKSRVGYSINRAVENRRCLEGVRHRHVRNRAICESRAIGELVAWRRQSAGGISEVSDGKVR